MANSCSSYAKWPSDFRLPTCVQLSRDSLFALHPGYQIDIHETPELALAARKSLDYRIQNGGGHTGWSAAWLISQYARLEEAESARHSLNTVLSKSTNPNLFSSHPPF